MKYKMFITSRYSVLVLYLFILVFGHTDAVNSKVGDQCSFKDGSKGICEFLAECQYAQDSLAQGVFPENSCEYEGTESIFCCKTESSEPSKSVSSSSTTSTTPTTTTRLTTTTTASITTLTTTQTTTASTKRTPTTKNQTQGKRIPGDTSKLKCEEYAKYVYDDSESPELVLKPHYSHTLECAFEKLPLIVGGTYATRQEFPHMVLIGFEADDKILWDCGGSLISDYFILTAAHCISHRQGGPAKHVKLGVTNQSDTSHLQERIVGEIVTYPGYTNKTKYHDIALLRLTEQVELNTYVRPACLNTEKEIKQNNAIASGWGNIGFIDRGSNDLLKVVLQFFPTEKCNKTYKRDISSRKGHLKHGIVEDLMICAGSTDDIKNTCQGDSGGPLQVYHEDTPDIMCMYDILGVTSFGKSCGLAKDVPGVYARVSNYIEWIENVVWPE